MVIDTSVIAAIALGEEGWEELSDKAMTGATIVASPTVLESHLVLRSRLGDKSDEALERILLTLGVQVVPFGHDHLAEARRAFDKFGKGRHPAALNFGDCVTYALSKVSGQPLLYVGNDFSQTDLTRA